MAAKSLRTGVNALERDASEQLAAQTSQFHRVTARGLTGVNGPIARFHAEQDSRIAFVKLVFSLQTVAKNVMALQIKQSNVKETAPRGSVTTP